mgnify:CR=1 FL=1
MELSAGPLLLPTQSDLVFRVAETSIYYYLWYYSVRWTQACAYLYTSVLNLLFTVNNRQRKQKVGLFI